MTISGLNLFLFELNRDHVFVERMVACALREALGPKPCPSAAKQLAAKPQALRPALRGTR